MFSRIIYLAFRKRTKKNRLIMPKIWQFSSESQSTDVAELHTFPSLAGQSLGWIKERFLEEKKPGLHNRETKNSVGSQIFPEYMHIIGDFSGLLSH